MLDFPPIATRELPPSLTVTTHVSGGSSKTTTSFYTLDAAYRASRDIVIFDNDGIKSLQSYGKVVRVQLAPTETVVNEPLADVEAHADFDEAIRKITDSTLIHYDCAAASVNRHTYIMDMLNVPDRLEALGRYAVLFVPVSARVDLAEESLNTFEAWRALFPEPHMVIPVVFWRDGDPRRVGSNHPLAKLIKIANDGVLVQPRVPMPILTQYRRTGMKLCELADGRDPLDTTKIAARTGIEPHVMEMMRRCAGDALANMDPQFQRLGFPLGL